VRIGVFGLGEAGSEIAKGLAATGVEVLAFDPAPRPTPDRVIRLDDPDAVAAGSEAILSLTPGADASTALRQITSTPFEGYLYADFATAAPGLKSALSAEAQMQGLAYVDVAIMGMVPGAGLGTHCLASGESASRLSELLSPVGMSIEVVGAGAGVAAGHKLTRSIVVKGLAAALIESLWAATAQGIARRHWKDMVAQLGNIDEGFLRRLVDGTEAHAQRRIDEMMAVEALLAEVDVEPIIAGATRKSLELVRERGVPHPPAG